MIVYLPRELDLQEHISSYNTDRITDFNKDELAYILSLLISIPANNKDIAKNYNGWAPISSALLANKLKNYRQYLDYALGRQHDDPDAVIIVTDNHYIVGEKSKAYRFKEKLLGSGIEPYILTDARLTKLIERELRNKRKVVSRNYPHLVRWFNNSLTIDGDRARSYAKELRDKAAAENEAAKMKMILGEVEWEPDSLQNPELQYLSSLENIMRIEEGNFFLSVDDNVKRFHSNLTNIKSELRNFITYDGHPLVSIDIKNAQPFLSTVLFQPRFYNGPAITASVLNEEAEKQRKNLNRDTRAFNISKVAFSIFKELNDTEIKVKVEKPKTTRTLRISLLESLIMFSKSLQKSDKEDVKSFVNLVNSGEFYDDLSLLLKKRARCRTHRQEAGEAVGVPSTIY